MLSIIKAGKNGAFSGRKHSAGSDAIMVRAGTRAVHLPASSFPSLPESCVTADLVYRVERTVRVNTRRATPEPTQTSTRARLEPHAETLERTTLVCEDDLQQRLVGGY